MMLGERTTAILAIFVISLAFVSGEVTREGDKITIRTKRQQCVCIVVSQANNQLQCNCDNTQPAITPQVQQQQQQELQKELQQIQSPQTATGANGSAQTSCGCVLVVIKLQGDQRTTATSGTTVPGSSVQHPQYQCQCDSVSQQPGRNTSQQFNPLPTPPPFQTTTMPPTNSFTTPSFVPQQPSMSESSNNPCACVQVLVSNGATQYQCDCNGILQDTTNAPIGTSNVFQDQATGQNFLSSALNQADYLGNNINNFQQPQQAATSAFTQAPMTNLQNTVATPVIQNPMMQSAMVPQSYLSSALNQANYLSAAATGIIPQQTQALYTTNQQLTQPQTQFSNTFQQDPTASQFDVEPATTTCITITVPGSCLCGNNYVQCADNMCCHKRYRSHKSEETAMDIIVDVLKNIKDRLNRS